MQLQTGIIGLPNVGKSTLFNALTRAQVPAANYPFTTIKPNVAVTALPDPRLSHLAQLASSAKIILANCVFVDIAGLIKGASQGAGLGNQFLSNIRSVHALVHVVRVFQDPTVSHVAGDVNPQRDVETINNELIFADQSAVTNIINRLTAKIRSLPENKQLGFEHSFAKKLAFTLQQGRWVNTLQFSSAEQKLLRSYNLFTHKPVLYVANVSLEDATSSNYGKRHKELTKLLNVNPEKLILMAVKTEHSLLGLPGHEESILRKEFGLSSKSGLSLLLRTTFTMLKLATFFTVGPKETRAWIFRKGATALECAATIHSDISRGFIRAEVISYDAYCEYHENKTLNGSVKTRLEGKNYEVQDGDVCHFRFNVSN